MKFERISDSDGLEEKYMKRVMNEIIIEKKLRIKIGIIDINEGDNGIETYNIRIEGIIKDESERGSVMVIRE